MANDLALLEYLILFKPSETWSNISTFESDLAVFMKAKGLQAEIVSPVGMPTRRVIYITKAVEPIIEAIEKPVSTQANLNKMRGK